MKTTKKIESTILIIVFLTMLTLPNIIMLVGLENNQENKQIRFKVFPEFNLNEPIKYVRDIKNYYEDNFGLKSTLVNNYIDFKFIFLEENPIPNRVVRGKEGWYFLGNEFNNTFNNSFGNDTFLNGELEKITQNIKNIKNYLSAKNILFYLVVPPDKNRIYQEKLPFNLSQNKTKLEILKKHLKKEIDFDIIDLTDISLTNKLKELIYLKTDTHWNEYGAFLGYNETINILSKKNNVSSVPISNYNLEEKVIDNGDIINMINLNIEEKAIFLNRKTRSNIITKKLSGHVKHYINPNKNLKLLMHHDSFANDWIRFFNESFGECIYSRGYILNKTLIEKEKPDILIFEIIERDIALLSQEKKLSK